MRINPSPKRQWLDSLWLEKKITDVEYVTRSQKLDKQECQTRLGHVTQDESEAMRVASGCRPEDIDNGNLERMIYAALRCAHWRGFRAGKAANTPSPDEEPQRGDTGTAAQREASLTPKITQEDGNG